MKEENQIIEVQFKEYVSISGQLYYLFNSKQLFSEDFLVSSKDYPKKMSELITENVLKICVKGIRKIDNKWLLQEIEWKN